ncbi:hypothetical protein [Rhizobium sp. MHM7A]|uniref:hypothetical protein n=1 Tax=Rhizobium sp. MHM7A TaxID=2583233 RepID=UPI001106B16B|nr:hypothetical protein [Rhizobium sp. MHM7A]
MLARAKTLQKKADELMSELVDLVGEEHASTDYADNIVVATDEMVDVIANAGYDMWNPVDAPKYGPKA